MLAVIAIILILVGLLMPALANLRGMAMIARCKAVLKNFGTAAIVYAESAEGRIPSTMYSSGALGPSGSPWTNAWLGNEVLSGQPLLGAYSFFRDRPGILQEYIRAPTEAGQSYYRCPLLPEAPFRSGEGSNGGFDYTQFSYTSGALLSFLPRTATVTKPDGTSQTISAPIYAEEDPRYGNNYDYIDPDHTSINRDGTWHYRQASSYFRQCSHGNVWHVTGPGGAGVARQGPERRRLQHRAYFVPMG